MNLVLLHPEEINNGKSVLTGRRLQHLLSVTKVKPGDQLKVGELNGLMGTAVVDSISETSVSLNIELSDQPPSPLPLTLILAMPRPKMLRRTLQTIAAMGVKNIYLINAYRVEKSFWQTPLLQEQAIQHELILGLEQARDTKLPQVQIRKRFKPFIEDELPSLIKHSTALVAHPVTGQACPVDIKEPVSLAIGPEGGFIPYEVDKLVESGFQAVHIGRRILRVENAVPALISRLYPGM